MSTLFGWFSSSSESLMRFTALRKSVSMTILFQFLYLQSLRACLIPQSSALSALAYPMYPQKSSTHFHWSVLTRPPNPLLWSSKELLPSVLILKQPARENVQQISLSSWFELLWELISKALETSLAKFKLMVATELSFCDLSLNCNSFHMHEKYDLHFLPIHNVYKKSY